MSTRRGAHTTTEEYQAPRAGAQSGGSPTLLCAFPRDLALPPPSFDVGVGRAWLAEAGVRDGKVSGEHVSFSHRKGQIHVEDLASKNGTWVDGEQIASRRPVPLDDGAVLRIGCTVLVYRAAFAGPRSPAPPLGKLVGPWGLHEVRAQLARLSSSGELNALIEGETGTGKELVAEAVIQALGRADKPRASVNVAAIPAGVFEGQLFGWEKGAYSGAAQAGPGTFRQNHGGSVFLDEIGELSLELQPKLLRLIEYREVQPVGSGRSVPIDVAVVAATNRPLAAAVEKGAFRRDLLARFAARIVIPPLADRPEDVLAILRSLATRRGLLLDETRADVEGVERLLLGPWPANVRDLDRIAMEVAARGRLTLEVVESVLGRRAAYLELTRDLADQMLKECGGNEHEVERRFGVKRGKLRRALGKVGRGRPVS